MSIESPLGVKLPCAGGEHVFTVWHADRRIGGIDQYRYSFALWATRQGAV